MFLGYSTNQSAFKCLDLATNKLFISRHVRFVESVFPFTKLNSVDSTPPTKTTPTAQSDETLIVHPCTSSDVTSVVPLINEASVDTPSPGTLSSTPVHSTHTTTITRQSPDITLTSSTSHPQTQQTAPLRTHTMTTRSQNNIFKPKQTFLVSKHSITPALEPTSVFQALQSSEWREAMANEFNALVTNGTWTLVPPTSSQNIVGNKWVYRVKRKADGTIDRFKARLVAKGFHQRPGLDFKETFSPVIKPTTIRTVLCIALSNGWSLKQLDVNNAFLQGTLSEEVYMAQPSGFVDKDHPHHVCKLHKAIYGLKQAPRAWYQELSQFVLSSGFTNSTSDASLFVYLHDSNVIYLLVYVDDLIITGNNQQVINNFVHQLSKRFSLKELGVLNFFLGIEVIHTASGLFLSQHQYIRDILDKFNMINAKETTTPMASNTQLKLHDGTGPTNATTYRQLIGSLQYLSLTRPDVAFAINKLSQFMHAPSELHWAHLKRVLRYLKGTIQHGLILTKNSSLHLTAFSDADWGGDLDDRTSTTGYILFLGNNPVSWKSVKQKSVVRSSTEAEYRALANTAAEILWFKNLLIELHVPVTKQPLLLCDNIGATYLSANPVFHSRMKHLALDYHFVRQHVHSGDFKVTYVTSKDQLADGLTKPLAKQRFLFLRNKTGVANGSTILQGHIKSKH